LMSSARLFRAVTEFEPRRAPNEETGNPPQQIYLVLTQRLSELLGTSIAL
jgi:hypothetical protein